MPEIDVEMHLEEVTVIGYLGGCFGNSLATALRSSVTGVCQLPNGQNFHILSWPYDMNQCMITQDSDFKLLRPLLPGECIQVHCLNGQILSNKFPKVKKILLTCEHENEKYAIHRQWAILSDLTKPKFQIILNAWDWINFHLDHYHTTGRVFNHDDEKLLNLDFLDVPDKLSMIEDFLQIQISADARKALKDHYAQQIKNFYQCHDCFNFSWQLRQNLGSAAPIEILASDFDRDDHKQDRPRFNY